MTLNCHLPAIAAVGVWALCCPTEAWPQASAVRPVLGGSNAGRHTLDLSASLAEGYDSDVPADAVVVDPTGRLSGGWSTLFSGGGDYHWAGSRVQVDASGASAARYYNELHAVRTASHTAGLGINADLGGRTKLVASQVASYSPSYLYGLFPREAQVGDEIPPAPDYNVDVSNAQSYSYGTKLNLTRGLSRRTSMSATGELQYTDFQRSTAVRRDVGFHRMGVKFSRSMSRHSSWNVGYDYRAGQFGYEVVTSPTEGGAQTSENAIQVGAEYTRPLSATRRLVVNATLGSAAVASSRVRSYRFLGETSANYQFSRMWHGGANFRRALDYVPEFLTPVLATGLNGRIEGRLSQRSTVTGSAGYSSGESALVPQEPSLVRERLTFRTYTVNGRLQHALNGTVAAYAEYLYYFYDVGGSAASTPGLVRGFRRHGARVGLAMNVRAFRR